MNSPSDVRWSLYLQDLGCHCIQAGVSPPHGEIQWLGAGCKIVSALAVLCNHVVHNHCRFGLSETKVTHSVLNFVSAVIPHCMTASYICMGKYKRHMYEYATRN